MITTSILNQYYMPTTHHVLYYSGHYNTPLKQIKQLKQIAHEYSDLASAQTQMILSIMTIVRIKLPVHTNSNQILPFMNMQKNKTPIVKTEHKKSNLEPNQR